MAYALTNAIKIAAIVLTFALGAALWQVGTAPMAHHVMLPAAMVTGGAG